MTASGPSSQASKTSLVDSKEETIEQYVKRCLADNKIASAEKFYERPFDTFCGKFGVNAEAFKAAIFNSILKESEINIKDSNDINFRKLYEHIKKIKQDLNSIFQYFKKEVKNDKITSEFEMTFKQGYIFKLMVQCIPDMQKSLGKEKANNFQKIAQLLTIASLDDQKSFEQCQQEMAKRMLLEKSTIRRAAKRSLHSGIFSNEDIKKIMAEELNNQNLFLAGENKAQQLKMLERMANSVHVRIKNKEPLDAQQIASALDNIKSNADLEKAPLDEWKESIEEDIRELEIKEFNNQDKKQVERQSAINRLTTLLLVIDSKINSLAEFNKQKYVILTEVKKSFLAEVSVQSNNICELKRLICINPKEDIYKITSEGNPLGNEKSQHYHHIHAQLNDLVASLASHKNKPEEQVALLQKFNNFVQNQKMLYANKVSAYNNKMTSFFDRFKKIAEADVINFNKNIDNYLAKFKIPQVIALVTSAKLDSCESLQKLRQAPVVEVFIRSRADASANLTSTLASFKK